MRDTSAEHNPAGDTAPARPGNNFIMYCRHCEARQLIPDSNVESKHRTSEGMIGYVRCASGHLVIHQFASAYSQVEPPASVIALRARQAAAETTPEQDSLTEWPIARP